MQKAVRKNTKYSKNETILKIGHHAKAIAFAKSSLLVKSLNFKKHVKTYSKSDLELFCAKNRWKKHQTFEKIYKTILKIGHYASKAYSLCKIVILGQKFKFQKTCQNPFYKSFKVVVCKKPFEKTLNIRKMRRFSKLAIMQRL